MYISWTLVASSYKVVKTSQLPVLTVDPNVHTGIFDWFLLSFWPPSKIQNNAFTSQKQFFFL